MDVSFLPVFSLASYDLGDLDGDDFGLSENPCIPEGISDDPLFPLLKNDPEVNNGANWLKDYEQTPSPQDLAAAYTIPHP